LLPLSCRNFIRQAKNKQGAEELDGLLIFGRPLGRLAARAGKSNPVWIFLSLAGNMMFHVYSLIFAPLGKCRNSFRHDLEHRLNTVSLSLFLMSPRMH
jgi:hypothetical protein